MKKTSFFLGILFPFLSIIPQNILYKKYNGIRAGDMVIKQQVSYIDPGDDGENVIWNFSASDIYEVEYNIDYYTPDLMTSALYDKDFFVIGCDTFWMKDVKEDELIIAVEHNTMYFYQYREDTLFVLGHENPFVLLKYDPPLLVTSYPLAYGDKVNSEYSSNGLYSDYKTIQSEGIVTVEIDAFGILIPPTGDTIRNVLRQKTVKKIKFPLEIIDNDHSGLSVDSLFQEVECYQWFAKGYRYPIFETIRSHNMILNEKSEVYSTSFFYPLPEHNYLFNDWNNSMIIYEEEGKSDKFNDKYMESGNFSYNIFPNPIELNINIEYSLNESAEIIFQLCDISGKQIKIFNKGYRDKGYHCENIDVDFLPSGDYLLYIRINEENIIEKIIKK